MNFKTTKTQLDNILISDLSNIVLDYLKPVLKEEFETDERNQWLSLINSIDNKVDYFDTMKGQKEENLKVGDVFIVSETSKYHTYAIITRMTKKTIFFKVLKHNKISRWFNNNDWGSSEDLFTFNIKNLYDMKEKRMKKQELDIIDTDKINLNVNFYYHGNWQSSISKPFYID